jgi:hypothetical protein
MLPHSYSYGVSFCGVVVIPNAERLRGLIGATFSVSGKRF